MEETNLATDEMMLPPPQPQEETTQIQVLYLTNRLILISEIEEVGAIDIGQPDCKLTNPCLVEGGKLSLWLRDVTNDNVVMMSSDKILTMVDPTQELLSDYASLTQ